MTTDEFFNKLIAEIQLSPTPEILAKGFSTPSGDYRNIADLDDKYYLSVFDALSKILDNTILVEYNPDYGVESCLCKPVHSHVIYSRD